MAWETNFGLDKTRTIDPGVTAITLDSFGNYSSGGLTQYSVVKLNTAGSIGDVIAATTGDFPEGVLQSNSKNNGPKNTCSVRYTGTSKVQASAAITIGQLVYVANASGQVGPIPADGATSVYIVGQALQAATAVGDIIMVQLMIGSQRVIS